VKVGETGVFGSSKESGWGRDRRYRAPAKLVRYDKPNTLAILIKDFKGDGGFLGQPFIGAALSNAASCRFLAGDGKPEDLAAVGLDDTPGGAAGWVECALPDLAFDTRVKANPGWGWYRFRFDAPSGLAGRDLLADLGRVYDAAACYLNGQEVGRMGAFPSGFFSQTAGRFKLLLPASLLKPKDNVLAVRVYNADGFGGLVGVPCLAFLDQPLLGEKGLLEARLAETDASLPPERLLDLGAYLEHSGRAEGALALADRVLGLPDLPPQTARRAQCGRVYALWLLGRGAEAWAAFRGLDLGQGVSYGAASAMSDWLDRNPEAASELASQSNVLNLGKDARTRGDWDFYYGLHTAVLSAAGAPFDTIHGAGKGFGYRLSTGSPDEVPRCWLGAPETADPRALFLPSTGKRRYASWDDRGEIRPFDDNGPDLFIDALIPAGPHLLSLYLVDWDW